ncbi:MAG: DUF899 domain-containing protein [Acidimicrobiia bacterium]|nr:DUF899 domain-containing protein [Acidimicrobiia bacterium]
MQTPTIASVDDWRTARLELLAKEKELNRLRDQLAAERRALPWVPVEKNYQFETESGTRTLAELFGENSQLLVYHFMMGPDWEDGCPSCSFWADTYDGNAVHLAARDVTFLCASRAPLANILAYKKRMGWNFEWVSSEPSEFNFDFGVSFNAEQRAAGAEYNYRGGEDWGEEAPGLSAFALHDGAVYHTYSTYSRGLDPLNGAYQLLDLAPKGRDEASLEWPMAWLHRHDAY